MVVFGHTHKSELDKDWFLSTDRLYANTGYWCSDSPTFVEVDKCDDGYKVIVSEVIRNDDDEMEFKELQSKEL